MNVKISNSKRILKLSLSQCDAPLWSHLPSVKWQQGRDPDADREGVCLAASIGAATLLFSGTLQHFLQILHPVLQMKLRQEGSFVKLNRGALQRGRMGHKSLWSQGLFSATLLSLLLSSKGINFLFFTDLEGFFPFSLEAKAQPLM